jgi:hypothetical protein
MTSRGSGSVFLHLLLGVKTGSWRDLPTGSKDAGLIPEGETRAFPKNIRTDLKKPRPILNPQDQKARYPKIHKSFLWGKSLLLDVS